MWLTQGQKRTRNFAKDKKVFINITVLAHTQTNQVIHPPTHTHTHTRSALTDSWPRDEIRCEGEAAIAMLSE